MKLTSFLMIIGLLISINSNSQDVLDINKVQKQSTINNLLLLGDSLTNNNLLLKAGKQYEAAFNLAKEANNSPETFRIGFLLQDFYKNRLEDYSSTEAVLNALLKYATIIKHQDHVTRTNIELGRLHHKKQNFIEALMFYNTALLEVEKSNNSNLHWEVYTARGDLIRTLGDLNQAQKDFKNASNYITSETSDYSKSITSINISSSFGKTELDSTLHYAKLAACDCKPKTILRHCNLAYNNIGWAYYLRGDFKTALNIINTNVDLDKIEYGNSDNLYAALMHTLGVIYLELKEYKKAITHFEVSEKYFVKRKDIFNIVQTKEDLSIAYEKANRLKESIYVLRETQPFRNTLDSLKVTREVAKIESKKILEVKEQKISKLEQENLQIGSKVNRTKALSYCLAAFLIITMSVLLYRGYTNKIRFHQLNEELSMNRLKSLRSMMNPHFLFNSFSTLQNYILKKESLKANEYMAELSGLIRNVLSSSDSIYITFKDELQILESYISIEQERFNDSFKVDYTIDSVLIEENPTIPSMIIQPYIENAIIHGFSHLKYQGLLTITMEKVETHVICKIKDNGIGRVEAGEIKKENKGIKNLSIATRNTNERLKILSKVSQRSASVEINDLYNDTGTIPKGTEVVITLPI